MDSSFLNEFMLTSPALKPQDLLFKVPPAKESLQQSDMTSDMKPTNANLQSEQEDLCNLLKNQIAQQQQLSSLMISPAITPQMVPVMVSPSINPVTPSQLMRISCEQYNNTQFHNMIMSPMMTPTIMSPVFTAQNSTTSSGTLKPILPSTNFDLGPNMSRENMIFSPEFYPTGYEKRSVHKEAEQKRRDSMKMALDSLKRVIPTKPEKSISKIQVIQKARDHILELNEELNRKDKEIQYLKAQLAEK